MLYRRSFGRLARGIAVKQEMFSASGVSSLQTVL
jgi:hypothetical protein